MAEVFAGFVSYTDDQIGRVLDYLEESGQLDNTIVVVVSDNGASGEGGPNGSFNEWRFFNGVADTTESTLPHIDELGTPTSYNHYCTGWAWAFDTPFPYWKRWAGYEGGVADMCLVAWPAQIKASDEVRHQYIHAVDVVPTVYDLLGIEPPDGDQGLPAEPDRGRELRRRAHRPAGAGEGRRSSTRCSVSARSTTRAGWRARCTRRSRLGQVRARRVGALRPRARPRAVEERRRRGPRAARDAARACGSTTPGSTTVCRSTTAPRSSRCSPSAHAAAPDRQQYTYYPRRRRRARVAGGRDQRPVVHDRRGRRRSTPPTPRACSSRTAASPAATASTSRTRSCATRSTGSARSCYDIVADTDITPGRHVFTAEFAADGPEHRPDDAGLRGHADALRRRPRRSARARSSPSPATSASSATASASAATARHRSRPSTPRPSGSPAAPSTRSSSTSRARSTSTTRPRSRPGSRSTSCRAPSRTRAPA